MLAEIKTLFWLQWKLTAAMFRSTRLSVRWRVLGLFGQLFLFIFTIPLFIGMGVVLACWMLVLAAIWLPNMAGMPSSRTEKFLLSTVFTLFMGLPSAVAPMLMTGRDSLCSIGGRSPAKLEKAIRVQDMTVKRIGNDLMVEGYIRR